MNQAGDGLDDNDHNGGDSEGSGWGAADGGEDGSGEQWSQEVEMADGSSDGAVGSLGDLLGAAAQRQSQHDQGPQWTGEHHEGLNIGSLGQPLSQQSVASDGSLLSMLSELESHRRRSDELAAVDAEVRAVLLLAR